MGRAPGAAGPAAPLRWLGQLWASPLTAAGLLHGLVLGARPRGIAGGAVELVAPRRGPLPWFFRSFHVSAYTWGSVIVFRDEALRADEELRRHEQAHVRQCWALGPLMIAAYPAASLWCVLRGRRAYRDNWFEVEARRLSAVSPRAPAAAGPPAAS